MEEEASRSPGADSLCSAVCHFRFGHFSAFPGECHRKTDKGGGKAEIGGDREMERRRESNRKAKRKLRNRERQCLRHKEA